MLEDFLEAEQDASGVSKRDKDPDYIWQPGRQDRDGRGNGPYTNSNVKPAKFV